jgi:uncharacterized protein YbjT (DUF2867 family)
MSGNGGPAFVVGASGYTGQEVVARLRELENEVTAHLRPGSPRAPGLSAHCEALGATLDQTPWESEALKARLRAAAPALVFALLGTTKARMRAVAKAGGDAAEQSYETVDYGLTSLLLEACREACPQARFVYLSSLGVEDREPSNRYLHARWKLEQELRASGQPFTIARPSFITGPDRDERRLLEAVGASLFDGALGVARLLGGRRLRGRYASTDAGELAVGLVRAALDPGAKGATLHSEALRR